MMDPAEFREQTAARLLTSVARVSQLQAFVGLDGFVDEIVHVVDKRDNADAFLRLATISQLSDRIARAAGRSTNIELVIQRTKLGGNGPIMANALARLGIKVTYVGALGYPTLHPVFTEFALRAEVHSVAEPGRTDALEFDDGKVLLGKTTQLGDVNWANIQARYGRDKFIDKFSSADLVGFVNWTMLPFMSDLWAALLEEFCPRVPVGGQRRHLFIDLADPEKRTREDILRAMDLILQFEKYFAVTLGLNQKEAVEVGQVMGIKANSANRDGMLQLTADIQARLPVTNLVVHPVTYAVTAGGGRTSWVEGPFVDKPVLTTGAGDHFNSGFCLGKLLGFEDAACLLIGVTASGYYVGSGQTGGIEELAHTLRHWPEP